jgi:hypothetical protein
MLGISQSIRISIAMPTRDGRATHTNAPTRVKHDQSPCGPDLPASGHETEERSAKRVLIRVKIRMYSSWLHQLICNGRQCTAHFPSFSNPLPGKGLTSRDETPQSSLLSQIWYPESCKCQRSERKTSEPGAGVPHPKRVVTTEIAVLAMTIGLRTSARGCYNYIRHEGRECLP